MSKLDDILDGGLFVDSEGKPDYRTGKVRQQVKALMLELVGDDEDEDMFREDGFVSEARLNHYAPIVAKNDWRAELRKKIEEL